MTAILVVLALTKNNDVPATVVDPLPSNPSAEAAPGVLLVIGDSFSGGSDMNDGPEWPLLLAEGIDWNAAVDAVGGAGYLAKGQVSSITDRLSATIARYQPDMVIVAAGLNDAGRFPTQEIAAVAKADLELLQNAYPDVPLVLMSPFSNGPPTPELTALDGALAKIADQLGLPYVGVLDLFTDRTDLIGSDGVHPTNAGHQYMADTIEQRLRAAGVGL